MNAEIITLTEVLEILKNERGPHTISYTTLNMHAKKGGEFVTIHKAVLLKHADDDADKKEFTADVKQRPHKPMATNHAEHLILLFKDLDRPERKVIEVHARLISIFNGKKMRYGK